MKQYIHCKSKPVRYIDIIIVMDCNMQNMCAQSKVKHPENIPEDEKWSDTQLAFYNDFLDSVENSIQKYFIIDNQNQSVSYSYYFEFHTNIENWVLRVRISDHVIPHTRNRPDFNKNDNTKKLFRQIIIGPDKEFTSYPQAANAIDEICEGIHERDLDIISKSWKLDE